MNRRSHLTILFMALCLAIAAKANLTANNLYENLVKVNSEWKHHQDAACLQCPIDLQSQSYNGCITTHLMLVEKCLREKNISGLTLTQKANRNFLLNSLHKYWQAGNYPVNDYVNYKTPVFIDRNGTHCAVGYLMQQGGNERLAQQINANEKLAYIRDIKTGGVTGWASDNGFTVEELAWIQPDYMPTTNFAAIGSGTNKSVKIFSPQYYNNRLAIGGDFDTLNGLPCAHIGYFKDDQLNCYGDGLAGKLNALCQYNDASGYGIAAAGAFTSGDTIYPLATFTGSAWDFKAIPNRPNAVATAICLNGSTYFVGIAIFDTSRPGYEEIWFNTHNSGWQKNATVHGLITNVTNGSFGRCFVGSFDSIYLPRTSMPDTAIAAHNILFYNETFNGWTSLEGEVSDTVLAVLQIGEVTYFAGTCGSTANSKVCLTRYLNGVCQTMIENPVDIDTINYISCFDHNGSTLLYGGSFVYVPNGIGTYCSNLASVDLTTIYGGSVGAFNASVNAIVNWNNELFLGGDFTNASTNPNLPHLAKIGNPTALGATTKNAALQLYPNPADNSAVLNIPNEGLYSVTLVNTQGSIISAYQSAHLLTIDTKQLASGVYYIHAISNDGSSLSECKRLVVSH